MNKKFFIRCLISYLRDKLKLFLLFIVFTAVFYLLFYLYHIPAESVLYAFIICTFIGLIILVIDFCKYYSFHQSLAKVADNIHFSADDLPKPVTALEKDYHHIIRLLYDDRNDIINENTSLKHSMQDYYAMWVHQIKVPISAMYLLLGENAKNSPIGMELFKVEQYVEMALSYARLDSNATDYVFRKYSLDKIVKQAVKKYASLFISKKIKLNIDDLSVYVITDEKWLSFVIEQILSNSLKYTKKGGSISIYLHGPYTLVIEDTGIGISAEDINRVCERGFTGYNGRGDKKSTGLGLYLCKEILSRLNHSMRIESEPDCGTRVFINLSRRNIKME